MTEDKLFSGMSGDSEPKRWEKSWTVDGITKEIRVTQAKNGYVIRLTKYGDLPKKDGEGVEYKHVNREIISKTNPLESKKDPLEEKREALESALNSEEDINFENI